MVAEDKIGALIHIASRLIDVMNREIATLRDMRIADLRPLQEEKAALTATYEEKVRDLSANSKDFAAVGLALKQEFAEIAVRLNQVLANNERALHAAQVAHDRLLKAIVEAVEEDRNQLKGYTDSGTPTGAGQKRRPASTPLTLDTSL